MSNQWSWSVVQPLAQYNWVLNASFEAPATIGWTLYGGASLAATQSYRGSAGLYLPAGQTPISRRELVERIIADALPVRFQAQLHKIIWPPELRGV